MVWYLRHELKVHSKECSHRIVSCGRCVTEFKYRDLPRHHNMCHRMPVRCELGCDKLVIRENMTQHMYTECGEKEVNCPFLQYGCKVGLIRRKEMNQHLEDKKFKHMVMKVNSSEETVMKQKETIMQLVRNNEHMVMKVNSSEETVMKQKETIMQQVRNNEHMVMKVNSLEETVVKQNERISLLSLLSLTVVYLLGVTVYDNVLWKVKGITDILQRNKSLTSEEFILHGFPMTFTLIASTNPISIRFQIVPSRQKTTLPLRALTGYFITRLPCLNDDSALVFKSKEYLIGEPTGMLLKMVLYTEGEVATMHRDHITAKFIKDGEINFRIAFKHCT